MGPRRELLPHADDFTPPPRRPETDVEHGDGVHEGGLPARKVSQHKPELARLVVHRNCPSAAIPLRSTATEALAGRSALEDGELPIVVTAALS